MGSVGLGVMGVVLVPKMSVVIQGRVGMGWVRVW